jgi:hypothetical protein
MFFQRFFEQGICSETEVSEQMPLYLMQFIVARRLRRAITIWKKKAFSKTVAPRILRKTPCSKILKAFRLAVCRASRINPQKSPVRRFLAAQTAIEPKVRRIPIIGIFVVLCTTKIHKRDKLLAAQLASPRRKHSTFGDN